MKFKKKILSLKWDKRQLIWKYIIPKRFKKNELFFQCPNCKTTASLRMKIGISTDGTYEQEDWFCTKCLKEVDYEKLSNITKNFLKVIIKDWENIISHPVKMVITNRKGTKIDGKITAIGGLGVQYIGESLIKKCGYCGKKNKFRVYSEKDKLEQCINCGFINKI